MSCRAKLLCGFRSYVRPSCCAHSNAACPLILPLLLVPCPSLFLHETLAPTNIRHDKTPRSARFFLSTVGVRRTFRPRTWTRTESGSGTPSGGGRSSWTSGGTTWFGGCGRSTSWRTRYIRRHNEKRSPCLCLFCFACFGSKFGRDIALACRADPCLVWFGQASLPSRVAARENSCGCLVLRGCL